MLALEDGWEAAAAPPGAFRDPAGIDELAWMPARVPGTAAGTLRDAGLWRSGAPDAFDAQDWWFRTRFTASPPSGGERIVLCLDGIATVFEVFLNGELQLRGDSMWAAHALDVSARLRPQNDLAICCHALAELLARPRRPRARWRSRLPSDGALRWYRTTLLGRAPGFAPDPAPVGPWRPVRLERRPVARVEELALRARLDDADGVLEMRARVLAPPGAAVEAVLDGPSGEHRVLLARDGERAHAELRVAGVARWWPHTHGEPVLHHVSVLLDGHPAASRRVGFRTLAPGPPATGHDVLDDGLDLHVNEVRTFARGAVWTPLDPVGLAPSVQELRTALEAARDAGMNMLRLPGFGTYESPAFYDLCDELGVLVWQDFMFANLDYPVQDDAFRTTVEREARQVLDGLAGRPSLAVLCGNSEVEQQVAMLGLDPALGRGTFFGEVLPGIVAAAGLDAVYVPSAPCGGDLPFRPNRGIANYYGVGGYRRPLEDARRAEVRFAAECLAFANVGEDPQYPDAGVARDVGSAWDFADVRDHYLALLFGADPRALRAEDPARYLELSRAVSGEVMAEVFGEWRRAGSPCGGGLVLWLRDLAPGSGWGVIDHRGEPKLAYHHLRRALAPVAVWMTDEGLNGVAIHVANDRSEPLAATLRVALYRDLEVCVGEVREELDLPPHAALERSVESMLGRFSDASWAYRFGPPAQDAIVVSLERSAPDRVRLISQSSRFPAGRPLRRQPTAELGLMATAEPVDDGGMRLVASSRRLAYGVRVHAPGFAASDDAFCVEPGGERIVRLRPRFPDTPRPGVALSALNLAGMVPVVPTGTWR